MVFQKGSFSRDVGDSIGRCQRTIARKTPVTSNGMGSWRGIDQELTLLSNSVYKILPWRFRTIFVLPRERTKSSWLKVD